MRFEELAYRVDGLAVTVPLHRTLTVLSGLGADDRRRSPVTPCLQVVEDDIGVGGLDDHIGGDADRVAEDDETGHLRSRPVRVVESDEIEVFGCGDRSDDRPGELPTRSGNGDLGHHPARASVNDSSKTWSVMATSSSVWAAVMKPGSVSPPTRLASPAMGTTAAAATNPATTACFRMLMVCALPPSSRCRPPDRAASPAAGSLRSP